jgi:hypothetical protein
MQMDDIKGVSTMHKGVVAAYDGGFCPECQENENLLTKASKK